MKIVASKAIVVLGMHRSGTSAIARGLEVLGVTLGNNLHPADADNPKGFWEDRDFLAINEELLAHSGSAYDRLGLIDWKAPTTSTIASLGIRAEKLVREKCDKSTCWGFKDPRTARLLPFWQSIFESVGCEVGYVIAIRNPISVVESLRKHGFEPERAFYLWLEHLVPALSRTRGAMRVVVDYDQLLENPELQLLRVAQALGLHNPEPLALSTYKNEFLERSLRHTFFTVQDLALYQSAPSQVVTAYDWLAKLSNDDFALDSPEIENAFEVLSRDLAVLSPALDLMARQEQITTLKHQTSEIQRLEEFVEMKHSVVEQLGRDLEAQRRVIEQLYAQLDQIKAELQVTKRNYSALKQTRWFRLREILLFHPRSVRKLLRLADIVAGDSLPHKLRSTWVSQLDRLLGAAPTPLARRAESVGAYRVKTPSVPDQTALKVVHVIANFMTGGSSRLVVDLVEYLGSSYRQAIFTSYNPDPPAYVGVEIDVCRIANSIEPFVEYFTRTRPDFLHVHYWGDCDESWYAMAIEAANYLGLPVIENINTPVEPYRSKTVASYVYVSDYVRSVFGETDSRHVTIYPGSDFSLFTRGVDDHAPDDCVGMVYRLERDKLNEESILPFIRIVQLRPRTQILIVGGGSLLDSFQSAVQAAGVSGNFEFSGYVSYDALPALYRRIGLFLAPVWKESFGQVVPFAMSMKIPVVGYDVGALNEIIGSREQLAPAEDAEGLAQIAVRLLDAPELRRKIGETLQKRAETTFSIQTMNCQYEKLYANISELARRESV